MKVFKFSLKPLPDLARGAQLNCATNMGHATAVTTASINTNALRGVFNMSLE